MKQTKKFSSFPGNHSLSNWAAKRMACFTDIKLLLILFIFVTYYVGLMKVILSFKYFYAL